ncbi:MAG TPA: gliding motility-associated C-terminal domain-containing protein, partial [Flavobacteriales bacterium]|nr:gliding motility-associated C-terminal domain-containing protein [Flavobacteriales bacterium]
TQDLSDLSPGNYAVTVSDANGCIAEANATVNGSPAIEASANPTNITCFGDPSGALDLNVSNGTAPFTFQWNNGATTEDLTGITAGNYSVTITDAAGCSYTTSFSIQAPTAIAFATHLSSYAQGYNVSAFGAQDGSIATAVSGGVEPYTFAWSNGATTESISGLPAGTYTLVVTDANGCTASLTAELTEATDLEMPTAYSPNNDGANDRFVVRGIEGYPRNLLTILNRWGNVVYEQPNYKNEWAGQNGQGDELPNGTYFVILSINDGSRTLQGFVDLRR